MNMSQMGRSNIRKSIIKTMKILNMMVKTNEINTSLDRVLFDGDAEIEYKNHQDTTKKLKTYNIEAAHGNFKINWKR